MKLIALLLALCLSGCAITRSPASDAVVADVASTGVGLALGAAEANPLGLVTIPVKLSLLAYAENLPDGEKQQAQTMLSAVWNGAAVNNVCVIAVILTGGAASFPCILLGLGYGAWEYTSTKANQMQAEFTEMCLSARKEMPNMKCFYKGVQL